jgi:hypothetical protein
VDDDASVRELLGVEIASRGYDRPSKAVPSVCLREHAVDVVVTDLRIDGRFDTAR